MNRDEDSLLDIYLSGKKILSYVRGMTTQQQLDSDEMRVDAIIRRIEIIGEATKRLSKEFREQNCHIPWKKMIGMRNLVIHEYDKVALDVVWDVIENNIPELLEKIAPLIPHESD